MAIKQAPNEAPNPEQIAPGAEAGAMGLDTPYIGWRPNDHIGYPLNESLAIGIDHGRS